MEHEKFQGKLWVTGNTIVVSIPKSIRQYGGYKEGDQVKIYIQKVNENE